MGESRVHSGLNFQLVPFTLEDFERLCRDFPGHGSSWKSHVRSDHRSDIAEMFAVSEDSYLVRVPDAAPESPYPHNYAFRHGCWAFHAALVDLGDVVRIFEGPTLTPGDRLSVERVFREAFDAHGYLGTGVNDGICGDLTFVWSLANS